MSVDPSRIKPVTLQKTLLLINNFVVNTSIFLNSFSESCEKKISAVSSKVTELEILLAVLEAKLNSIPGLEFTANDLPSTDPANSNSTTTHASSTSVNPVPATNTTSAISSLPSPAVDDRFVPYIKMKNILPEGALRQKMQVDGFSSHEIDNFVGGNIDAAISPTSTAIVISSSDPSSASLSASSSTEGMVAAKDHPDYAPFFKMLKVFFPL